jgi:hypothetical protein
MSLISDLTTVLSSNLGVFKTLNRPAIANEASNYEHNIIGSGLLCLVPSLPINVPTKLLGGRNYYPDVFRIVLINYSDTSASSANLFAAVDKIYDKYECFDMTYQSKTDAFLEQVYIDIFIPTIQSL